MSKEPSFGQFLLAEKVSRTKYSPVSGQEDGSESETSLDGGKQTRTRHKGSFWVVLPWGLTALFGLAHLFQATLARSRRASRPNLLMLANISKSWRHGSIGVLSSETTAPCMRRIQVQYDMREIPHKYPDVNANWEELIDGRYFRITEQEAYESFGENYMEYWDPQFEAYVTGIEMSYILYCVNYFRRAYYPEIYYPKTAPKMPDYALPHRDHCIEHVRQYIMCHGDMTPTPTRYFKAIDRNYVLSDTKHTCRDFGKLYAWMLDRFNGASSVGRYNGTPGMGS